MQEHLFDFFCCWVNGKLLLFFDGKYDYWMESFVIEKAKNEGVLMKFIGFNKGLKKKKNRQM